MSFEVTGEKVNLETLCQYKILLKVWWSWESTHFKQVISVLATEGNVVICNIFLRKRTFRVSPKGYLYLHVIFSSLLRFKRRVVCVMQSINNHLFTLQWCKKCLKIIFSQKRTVVYSTVNMFIRFWSWLSTQKENCILHKLQFSLETSVFLKRRKLLRK